MNFLKNKRYFVTAKKYLLFIKKNYSCASKLDLTKLTNYFQVKHLTYRINRRAYYEIEKVWFLSRN